MRERDAAAYHDYKWPYGAHTVLHRSPAGASRRQQADLVFEQPAATGPGDLLPQSRKGAANAEGRAAQSDHRDRRTATGLSRRSDQRDVHRVRVAARLPRVRRARRVAPVAQTARAKCRCWNRTTTRSRSPARASKAFGLAQKSRVITSGRPLEGRMPTETINWSLLDREYDRPTHDPVRLTAGRIEWQTVCRSEVEAGRCRDRIEGRASRRRNDRRTMRRQRITLESFEEPDTSDSAGQRPTHTTPRRTRAVAMRAFRSSLPARRKS